MATAAPALSDDALAEMLSLMKGAGSMELKLTIPESVQRSTVLALGMDPLGAPGPARAAHAPEGIGFEDLSLLGPIFVLKLKAAPEGYARKMVVELWLYPDGTRILELSTKCAPTRPSRSPPRHRDRRRADDEDAQGARVLLQAVAPHLTNMCRWNAFGQPVAVDAGARRHDPAACARSRRYSGCVAQ